MQRGESTPGKTTRAAHSFYAAGPTRSAATHHAGHAAHHFLHAAFLAGLLHHLLHLLVLLEQTVEVRHLQTGTRSDTPLARTVDDVGLAPLLGRHRVDQRLKLAHLLLRPRTLGQLRHLPHAGQLAEQTGHATHFLELLKLVAKILKIEALALLDLPGELFGFFLVDRALGLFDQRQHVAHAENT